jgi:hypothetical protein
VLEKDNLTLLGDIKKMFLENRKLKKEVQEKVE